MNTKAVKAILGLVADAESAASVEAYHDELLAVLTTALPGDVLVFNDFHVGARPDARRTPAVSCTASPPTEPRDAVSPALLGVFLRLMTQHPLIWLHATGDHCAHRLSDVTSMRAFRRGALYGEFFRPAAIGHQLTLGLDAPPSQLVGVWISRARRDFSEDELLLAELLRPQLQAGEVAARRAAARAALTQREREVLDIVAAGATNAAVAEALVVSPATVKKHLDNIYAKLGVGSRAGAVDRAGVVDRSRTGGTAQPIKWPRAERRSPRPPHRQRGEDALRVGFPAHDLAARARRA
jgi:DNA-binding CsgD family transcriptional regulator